VTEQEWQARLENASSPQEVKALLAMRPKGAKTLRSGGCDFNLTEKIQRITGKAPPGTPLLDLQSKGRKAIPRR